MINWAPNMQRDTDSLIRGIYDAVDNVDALPDVLSSLCERIGGENGMLGVRCPIRFSSALILQ